MRYRFTPNRFAAEKFNLTAAAYTGDGMTPVLEEAIGKENYDRYMVAQDPLCGGKTEGNINIILNRDESDPARMRFESIGTIQTLPDTPFQIRLK